MPSRPSWGILARDEMVLLYPNCKRFPCQQLRTAPREAWMLTRLEERKHLSAWRGAVTKLPGVLAVDAIPSRASFQFHTCFHPSFHTPRPR